MDEKNKLVIRYFSVKLQRSTDVKLLNFMNEFRDKEVVECAEKVHAKRETSECNHQLSFRPAGRLNPNLSRGQHVLIHCSSLSSHTHTKKKICSDERPDPSHTHTHTR